MRKVFKFLIILTSLLFSCTSDKDKAKIELSKADKFYQNKDYGNASKEIDSAFMLDSANYDILILKAKIKAGSNLNEEAIQLLKNILPKNFKTDTVYFLIGDSYFNIGYYFIAKKKDSEKATDAFQNSIKYYDSSISKNTQYFASYLGKQRALHNLGRYDEALIVLNTAISFFPDSISLIFNRGVEKSYLGDNIEAMIDINKSIQSNRLDSNDLGIAYRFRGNIYLVKDSLEKAIEDISISISYNPTDEIAYLERAEAYRAKGLKDKACEDYRKSADLGLVSVYEKIKEYCGQ